MIGCGNLMIGAPMIECGSLMIGAPMIDCGSLMIGPPMIRLRRPPPAAQGGRRVRNLATDRNSAVSGRRKPGYGARPKGSSPSVLAPGVPPRRLPLPRACDLRLRQRFDEIAKRTPPDRQRASFVRRSMPRVAVGRISQTDPVRRERGAPSVYGRKARHSRDLPGQLGHQDAVTQGSAASGAISMKMHHPPPSPSRCPPPGPCRGRRRRGHSRLDG